MYVLIIFGIQKQKLFGHGLDFAVRDDIYMVLNHGAGTLILNH